jgi:putative addiction module killer protein
MSWRIEETATFRKWLLGLRDRAGQAVIAQRIARLAAEGVGDVKPVGYGVSELRINYGPGYRVYFLKRGDVLIVLLCGGDKDTQARDIVRAKALAKEF